MRSPTSSRWTMTELTLLAVLAAIPARAQVSCKLLQPAELETALKEWAAGACE